MGAAGGSVPSRVARSAVRTPEAPRRKWAGVVSSDPSKVQADVGAVPVWPDLSQALTAGAYDVVVLATPNALHAEQARLAEEARETM